METKRKRRRRRKKKIRGVCDDGFLPRIRSGGSRGALLFTY